MNKSVLLPALLVLLTIVACTNNDGGGDNPDIPVVTPPVISYSIIETFPHDTSSYTEGLLIYNGQLYEGTGEYGQSKLLQVDLKTGVAKKQLPLDAKYFGEGIVILRDTVYQLTYRENTGFMYSLPDFKLIKTFPTSFGEGWGMTTDGKEIIATNGSANLYFFEPGTFQLLRTQAIDFNGSPIVNLNELEYINGFVYANQYTTGNIFKIDAEKGAVVGMINVQPIWDDIKRKFPTNVNLDVPNGIAYDTATSKMYITGKNWPELYEIKLGQ